MIKTAKNRRLMLNGVLLVLVLGLMWLIVKPDKRRQVVSLYDEAMGSEIDSIVIHYPTKNKTASQDAKIELKKTANQWRMIRPIKVAIDNNKIKHLTTVLFDPIDASYPVIDKDLSVFGLTKAKTSVIFNGVEIEFGSLNPISHKRYIRKGDRIYLVAEIVYGLVTGGVDGFM